MDRKWPKEGLLDQPPGLGSRRKAGAKTFHRFGLLPELLGRAFSGCKREVCDRPLRPVSPARPQRSNADLGEGAKPPVFHLRGDVLRKQESAAIAGGVDLVARGASGFPGVGAGRAVSGGLPRECHRGDFEKVAAASGGIATWTDQQRGLGVGLSKRVGHVAAVYRRGFRITGNRGDESGRAGGLFQHHQSAGDRRWCRAIVRSI